MKKRRLKVEWWEVWWVKPGSRPVMHSSDGEPIAHWVPRGVFPDRAEAFLYKKKCKNRFMKVVHVKRFVAS